MNQGHVDVGQYATALVTWPSCTKRQVTLVPLLTLFGTDSVICVCTQPQS